MAKKTVKIGLALGGGGAKGAAHIGALRVFEKHGIQISSIVGTSAGAIVGAGYALGLSPDEIIERTKSFNSKKFLRIGNIHLFNASIMKARDVNTAIYSLVGDKTFQDLKIPFSAVAVDLEEGKEVLLKEGKLWEAVRASAALPGILSPIFMNEKYLIDGGTLNNVPANYLRDQKDIDIVVAIDLGTMVSRQYISGMIWEKYYKKPKIFHPHRGYFAKLKINSNLMLHIILRSVDILREDAQKERIEKAEPSLIIKPQLDHINILQFDKYKEAIELGEKAAEHAMPQLLELIKKAEQ